MATLDEVRAALTTGGEKIQKEERLPNDTGSQLVLKNDVKVNVFDSGRFNVQGKKDPKARVEKLLDRLGTESGASAPASRKVFVVYGHDDVALTQLGNMLRRWELEPIELNKMASKGQTIIEKLESCSEDACFAVVLATPDDEGHRAGHEGKKMFRVRQNVVLELGMMFAKLGRQRVAILLKSQANMEKPSDIHGVIYIPFREDVEEAGKLLAKELDACGITIAVGKL